MIAMVFLEKLFLCESVPEEGWHFRAHIKITTTWGGGGVKHNSGWGFWSLGIVPTAMKELVNCAPFAQTR